MLNKKFRFLKQNQVPFLNYITRKANMHFEISDFQIIHITEKRDYRLKENLHKYEFQQPRKSEILLLFVICFNYRRNILP